MGFFFYRTQSPTSSSSLGYDRISSLDTVSYHMPSNGSPDDSTIGENDLNWNRKVGPNVMTDMAIQSTPKKPTKFLTKVEFIVDHVD